MGDEVPRPAYRINIARRGIGIVIALAPLLLSCASLHRAATGGDHASLVGLAVVALGLVLAGLNFYLSLLWRGDRHVSVVPIVATVIIVIGSCVGFGSAVCASLGLVGMLVDTGGPAWFVAATWKDKSFWDTPSHPSS